MEQLTRRLTVSMGGMATMAAIGCSSVANLPGSESTGGHLPSGLAQMVRPTIAIQSLTADQTRETVHIKGTVAQQAPLLTGGLYQVQDDSGTIWVLSAEAAPAVTATVNVVGTVEVEAIAVEGIDISDVYLRETSRTLTSGDPAADSPDGGESTTEAVPPETIGN